MEIWRVHKRNRRLNLPTGPGNRASQPCLCIVLGARMVASLSLNGNGPTARFFDEDVEATAPLEHLAGLLASRRPTAAQPVKHFAQGDVQRVFVGRARHDGIVIAWIALSFHWPLTCSRAVLALPTNCSIAELAASGKD